jgi:hypothetical protein
MTPNTSTFLNTKSPKKTNDCEQRGWKWISYEDLRRLLGLGRNNPLEDNIRDNVSTKSFFLDDVNYKRIVQKTYQIFYLLKDVIPHIPK